MSWTDEKNKRLCQLVDLQINGWTSVDEESELNSLTAEFHKWRAENYPRPIQEAKAAFEEMASDAIVELHHKAWRKMAPEEYAEQYESFGTHTAISMGVVDGCQEVWVFLGSYVPKLVAKP